MSYKPVPGAIHGDAHGDVATSMPSEIRLQKLHRLKELLKHQKKQQLIAKRQKERSETPPEPTLYPLGRPAMNECDVEWNKYLKSCYAQYDDLNANTADHSADMSDWFDDDAYVVPPRKSKGDWMKSKLERDAIDKFEKSFRYEEHMVYVKEAPLITYADNTDESYEQASSSSSGGDDNFANDQSDDDITIITEVQPSGEPLASPVAPSPKKGFLIFPEGQRELKNTHAGHAKEPPTEPKHAFDDKKAIDQAKLREGEEEAINNNAQTFRQQSHVTSPVDTYQKSTSLAQLPVQKSSSEFLKVPPSPAHYSPRSKDNPSVMVNGGVFTDVESLLPQTVNVTSKNPNGTCLEAIAALGSLAKANSPHVPPPSPNSSLAPVSAHKTNSTPAINGQVKSKSQAASTIDPTSNPRSSTSATDALLSRPSASNDKVYVEQDAQTSTSKSKAGVKSKEEKFLEDVNKKLEKTIKEEKKEKSKEGTTFTGRHNKRRAKKEGSNIMEKKTENEVAEGARAAGATSPEELLPNPNEKLEEFVFCPAPRGRTMKCRVTRENKDRAMYPTYYVHLEKDKDKKVFLLAARKRKKTATSCYVLSTDPSELTRSSSAYAAGLRGDFLGLTYVLTEARDAPSESLDDVTATQRAPKNVHNELLSVAYESNVLGFKGPRKMTVLIPGMTEGGSRTEIRPQTAQDGLIQRWKRGNMKGVIELHNKTPVWSDETASYVLNFHGRVTRASVKNFQIVHANDEDYVVMQFGRIAEDVFTMDYNYPLCAVQALGIALSSFDSKLACE